MPVHPFPAKRHRSAFYERWVTLLGFLALGGIGLAYQFQERKAAATQLASAGLPIGTILIGASIIGVLVSLVVFRAPHDGQTEL